MGISSYFFQGKNMDGLKNLSKNRRAGKVCLISGLGGENMCFQVSNEKRAPGPWLFSLYRGLQYPPGN